MADGDDPRVFFAAERTLLAWIRTGLTVIGLGFVVARFGLFLRLLRQGPEAEAHTGSSLIGISLVLLGSVAIAVAAWQQIRFCSGLQRQDKPRAYLMHWSVAFATLLAVIGGLLALYLFVQV